MSKRLNERGLERRREYIIAHPGKRTEVLIDTGQELFSERRYVSFKQRVFAGTSTLKVGAAVVYIAGVWAIAAVTGLGTLPLERGGLLVCSGSQ